MALRRNNDRGDAHDGGGDGNGGFASNPPSPSLGPTALAQRLYISQSRVPKRIKINSGRRERKLEGEKLVSFLPSGGSRDETEMAVPGLLSQPSQSSLKCRMSSHGLTPELLNLIQPVTLEFDQETTEEVEEAVSMEWQILPCLKASIPGHVRESLLQTNPGSLHSKASLQVGSFPKVSGVITPHLGPIAIAASHTSQPLKPPGIPAVLDRKHKTKIEKSRSFENHDIMSWKSKRGSFAKITSEEDSCDYQWMAFLKLLRERPDYPEFIYLQPSAVRFSAFDPYDLEIVQRCEISSLYYYTMSSEGVTLFKGLDAEFTPLDEWEADFKFYKCVMKLNVFSKYKLWKALAIWRHFVRKKLQKQASKALQKEHFSTKLVLQRVISQIHQMSVEISVAQFFDLEKSVACSLDAFIEVQQRQCNQVREKMAQLSDKAISETKEACMLVLTSIEKELLEKQNEDSDANSKSENSSLKPRKSSGMNKLATVALKWKREKEKAVEERENRERYAFAVSVAKRNERQRLLKFLRLADYVITQCLRQIVIGSFIQLLQKLLHSSMQQTYSSLEVSNTFDIWIRDKFFKYSDPVLKCWKGQETLEKNRLPVFQVNLIIKDDRLQIHPSLSDFEKKFEQLAKNIPDAVKTVQRLIAHPDLVNIIESVPVDNGAPSHMELIGEKQLVALQSMIKTSISLDFQDAEATKVHFQPFLDVFIKNRSISIESMQKEVDQGQRDIGMFRADLDLFLKQITDINNLPLFQDVGAFRINSAILKESLLPSPQKCLQGIFSLLPQILADRHKVFIDEIHLATKKLLAKPSSVEEFVEIAAFLQSLQERTDSLEEQYLGIKEYLNLMQDYKIPIPEIDLTSYQLMGSEFNACKEAMLTAEEGKMENVKLFSVELVKQMDHVRSEVNSLRQQARHDMILDENCNMQEVLGYVCNLSEDMTAQKSQFQRIQQYRQLFQMDEIKYDELQEVADEVEMKKTLWQSLEELGIKTTTWANTHFEKLPMEEIEEVVQKYAKLVVKLERLLLPNKVTGRLRKLVDEFRFTLPVIQNLKNKSLKERHWKKIEAEMGRKLERNASFTLGKLLELKIMEFKGAIGNIANEAIQEAALEELLKKVQDKWMAIEFIVKPYKEIKDVYVLGSIDDVVASLEDSMVTMNTVTSSRYVTGIRSEVEKVEGQLKHFGNVLDEWLECQKQWMYLESIFSAPDIQRQLPNESKAFNAVDKQFKDIMKRVHDRPNALQAGSTPGWLETFEKCNETLEKIQKNLEDYLETKRMAFPRFYFLSNDELLEILAQTRNVQAVQPHMSKCFDGIRRLDFGDDPRSVDIYAMISSEGEKVSLGKNLKARGNVENWLTAVEQNMISSLRRLANLAHQDYAKRPRKDWVLKHPAQLVIMISQVYWCFSVESVFAASKGAAIQSDLLEIKDQCIRQLEDLSVLVRGNLLALERRILTALITIDVHARDIVEGLAREKVFKGSDFGWQMQLRYYWDDNVDDCMIRQTNASFLYGYEYLGAQPRLVITPLTDRCYMTLTGALHLKLGGAPAGPAGTGKTETTKDLAKALGIQCVVFNCGDNLDYKFMGKFFAGLAQCGAWACFDEFNRIDIEVLSVVAQQLLTIQNALKAAMPRFNFEGREIKLLPTCGVFITMNPGYAGRTELPDNLKVLFRPVSMMIPDYALVAEVMLFSEGFANAKILSRKMVKLYKLSSEQLSQQDHYDFGMRAVKSVLVMAGSLKRSNPDLNEDAVLIRAFKDSNLPKFLAQDVGLFLAIIADLFPGVNVPPQDFGVLKAAVEECIVDAGLQPVPGFVLKTIQLYETMNVRFGVMAVGPTGGGKTACYQMLQTAMTKLCEAGNPNPSFQVTQSYVLNPKSIKMGELYGEYNLLTNEWTDGLGSTIIRQCVSDTTADRKWVVFDGPVDAIWIENMNTVLDDNCILCLPNGERIKLNPVTMRMLFEVQDLAVASPATVSRCGMVYVPPEDLGWRPYVRTWLQKLSRYLGLTEAIPSTVTDYIWNLCDTYIDTGLKFLRQQCKENIPSVNINIVTSLCYYFQALCQPSKEVNLKQDLELLGPILNKFFCFSFIWSVGGNIDHHSIEKFDVFVRKDMEVIATFPESDLVYDYFFNPRDQTFTHWEIVVPGFVYHHGAPFFTLMVPTQDSTKLSFLMEISLEVQRSVLFQGVSGVGKSAIILDLLNRLQETKNMMLIVLNFSAQTTSIATQEAIESKLEKKRRTKLGAPLGKKIACFVDDVNMPAKERYGAQPAIELLRQFLDFKGFYDRRQLFWKDIEDMTILTACAPPGGGRNEVTPRFFRHFSMLCVQPPSEQCLRTIFGGILGGFLNFFPSECKNFQKPMVESTIEIYTRISQELLPTPAKSHYTFNLRDVSKVFQGILMVKPADCGTKRALRSLWVHESMRVFYDRLINNEDRDYFKKMIYDLLKRNFEETGTYEEVYGKSPMFGDFLKPGCAIDERRYEQVLDESRLPQLLKDYLEDYNASTTSIMKLVFFKDAIEHISRISRILRQPRGNAMLVGVGGSGKQSLTRFACFMGDYKCVQIELKKGYNMVDYREDLKKLYKIAGVEGIPVTFLLTDTQIINEGFIEDINNLLNSGEIPGLFTSDEKDRVAGDMREYVTKLGLPETKDVLYSSFINRARDNLHIVLCMSPVGDSFRARCRKFPSLINCCTIDWFNEWPEDALLSVSKHFLASVDLSTEQVKNNIANMCVEIHISVSQMAERFYQELRRKYYITPKSYLDCVNLYIQLLGEKRQELSMAQDRFMNGLNKLKETNVLIESMKVELGKLQPILAEKAAQTEKLIKQVANDQEAAQKVKEVVAKEEAEVKKQAEETQLMKDDAQKDLDAAMPALNASVEALNSLNKNDITEIKSFAKPPPLVQLVMEAVCVLLGEKPNWDTSKKIMGDVAFIRRLLEYNKDGIIPALQKKLAKYIEDPSFQPELVQKQSNAATSLCLWVRAMDVYAKVAKDVAPKKEALRLAEEALKGAAEKLSSKQQQLAQVEAQVERLKKNLQGTEAEQAHLQQQALITENRLRRAGKLTAALSDESVRWKETADEIEAQKELLVGDVFICAACIAYYGAFSGQYRKALVSSWIRNCQEKKIPVSVHCSLRGTLSTAVEVREWSIWGLPTDDVSVDNGILVTRGKRWPLMIDPQGQANSWIKAMEAKNGLRVVRLTDTNILRTLESSIRIGNPVLLEDIGDTLDPALEPILQKQVFEKNGRYLIRIGDSDIDYDPNFRFYMTTKMSNPHYMPDICIKVTLVNFTVTMKGLEDQLLGDVVRKERADLEEQNDRLVVSISSDKKQLKDLEDKILKLLKESQGNILDDEVLINTLNNSKLTSSVIQGRVKQAEVTEKEITAAREQYRVVSNRGSILYFVVSDLALIDSMYQYSLSFFCHLFSHCIDVSDKSDELDVRLKTLIDFTTEFVYMNVSRGLFEQHKLTFSFLICTSIMRSSGEIQEAEWNFFLRGSPAAAASASKPAKNPGSQYLAESVWHKICAFEEIDKHNMDGLSKHITDHFAMWKPFLESPEPHFITFPDGWDEKLNPFQRLVLLKCLREEKLVYSCEAFIRTALGNRFVETPPLQLEEVFKETSKTAPIIFILSTGADPTGMLQRFGEKVDRKPGERLHIISLGQGQGPIAEMLVSKSRKTGDWVCLQNCHLASSWMQTMERIIERFVPEAEDIHPEFRLWLTSLPCKEFPVPVLQNGIKITNEPPKGIRANLLQSYANISDEFLESCTKKRPWKKLVYAISFFHAVVQERRKFGPLGWNVRYDFNNSDLDCAMQTLHMFLEEQPEIPWPALLYVTGEITYGGRVTDDLDRRCLMSTLLRFYNPDVLSDSYAFTPSRVYISPPEGNYHLFVEGIKSLPVTEGPDVFGMHENANLNFQLQESNKILSNISNIQPQVTTAGGAKSPEKIVSEVAERILADLPLPLKDSEGTSTSALGPDGQISPLAVVLMQECDRYNKLLSIMKSTLSELQRAIKGLVVMSSELENMFNSFLSNQVPALWNAVAYPSLKTLSSWVVDFHKRMNFMLSWIMNGEPKCFWLPGFFFPQGFLTGALQLHARKYQIPIDTLNFGFNVTELSNEEDVSSAPVDGLYVSGLFLDGARWDQKYHYLSEAFPGEMHCTLPIVHLIPTENYKPPTEEYQCPLYKTHVRAGVLTTTGASSNFVLNVSLKIDPQTNPDFWVLQGVALLCQLGH